MDYVKDAGMSSQTQSFAEQKIALFNSNKFLFRVFVSVIKEGDTFAGWDKAG